MGKKITNQRPPKIGAKYYIIIWDKWGNTKSGEENLRAVEVTYGNTYLDNVRIAAGIAFRTRADAESEKYNVYNGLTGRLWGIDE